VKFDRSTVVVENGVELIFISKSGHRGQRGEEYEKKVQTVMVNNSTNVNKTDNHLSP
jgi:hypothetical protein